MKKMILIISVFLLFSQCKKESVEQEETLSREVPVTMRLSLNECRTYFDDVIDSGEIYWWNPENEFEYFYLAVEYTSLEWENGSSVVKKHGVLEELVFRAIDPTGVADMKGRMPEVYLKENRICKLYYFGNNGNGADGTNVENITDDRGNLIGKIMHFDKQRGDLKKVGSYHLASVDVRVMRNYGEDGVVTGYSLIPVSPLRNMMSLAVLDLRGERTLNGSATMQQSFSLKWSGSDFEEIVHVDFISNEHLGLTEEDRKVIFDISAHCNDGENLIIEMQKGYQKHFRKRALYYTTYPINEQGRDARDEYVKALAQKDPHAKFNWDYNLKPVTVVSILNFRFNHYDEWPDDQPRSSYRLREDESHELMTDVLRFVFLELGRFNKRIDELESVSDKWIYLLKYMHTMTEIPPEFSDPMFTRLFLLSEINKFTADEYKQYTKSLENMGDYTNIINTAAEEAEIRGREEGQKNKAIEIALKLMGTGMSRGEAAEFVGISESDLSD